jgi:hypothetical protein
MNQTERDAVTADIQKLDAQMKRYETQSLHSISNNIAYDLEYELTHNNAHTIDDESAGGSLSMLILQICIWLQKK